MTSPSDLLDLRNGGMRNARTFTGYAEVYWVIKGRLDGRDVKFMCDSEEEEARVKFFTHYPEAVITETYKLRRVNVADFAKMDRYKWEFRQEGDKNGRKKG